IVAAERRQATVREMLGILKRPEFSDEYLSTDEQAGAVLALRLAVLCMQMADHNYLMEENHNEV
ncbi:MAG: hypothetical protein Q4C56_06810, partial [Peptococcaceae bacterium]|nr:hypothetical protein [Peptococcaceae bacterium]